MAVKDAEKFIREIVENSDLRKSLYQFDDRGEKMEHIRKAGYVFEIYEFDESINYLKTISSDEEQAIMFEELRLWWQMIMPNDMTDVPAQSCTPAECATCSSCG